ncbi:MAG: lipopolysaccharide heptosyltransferase II [bacterium]|nr:lipopolysaccharide heptosyltransferase II [bacterium]
MFSHPRILIVKMSSIGDVIHALPAVKTLRNHFPDAELDWVVEAKAADILVGNPLITNLILFDREKIVRYFKSGHWIQGWREIQTLKQKLQERNYTLSIDLQGLARSAFIVILAKAKRKLGCYGMRELSYLVSRPPKARVQTDVSPNHSYDMTPKINARSTISNPETLHAVDRLLEVMKSIDSQIVPVIEFPIALTEAEFNFADEFLNHHKVNLAIPIIGINLGASNPLKRWQKEKFAELIDRLSTELQYQVILFGGEADTGIAHDVIRLTQSPPINAVGKTTLRQLTALIKRCIVFVSADTGPLHIAAAVGIPVVALFGPSDPNKTGPYTTQKIVIWKKPKCSPCSFTTECDYGHNCMQRITVNEVVLAIQELTTKSTN